MSRVISRSLILYLLILVVFEMTLLRLIRIGNATPLLVYLMVFYAGLEWGWRTVIPVAFCAGLMRDFTGFAPFGVEASSLVLAGLILDIMVQKIEHGLMFFRMAIAFLFVFCVLSLNYLFALVLGSRSGFAWQDLRDFTGAALYTALVYPVFFYVTALWFHNRRLLKQYELFR